MTDPNPATVHARKGVVGIQNLGNTCYANSVLQLLRASPHWTLFCVVSDFSGFPDTRHRTLLVAYQELLRAMWSASHPAYVQPIGFMETLRHTVQGTPYDIFGRGSPNDAHEFLVFLLDTFHEALNQPRPRSLIPSLEPMESLEQKATREWATFTAAHSSEVVTLFFGRTIRTIECGGCHHRSHRWEPFNVLKIPCLATAPMEEWIRQEVNEVTTLSDYRCDACHTVCTALLTSYLWSMPRNLFLVLRRFRPDGQKDMTPCSLPLDLSFESFYARESNDPHRSSRYELRGVVDHHGTHLGGHYTAQIKHQLSNVWWKYDDSTSMPSNGPSNGPIGGSSTYLLYFVRI